MVNQQLSTNTFGTAKWIVSATASDGTHTTIAAALTSASSGDTIFIRPGTYTENLTLKGGVNLVAYDADAFTPNVTITGKATLTTATTVTISGIRLTTNSDFFLVVSGTLASVVFLKNCYLNCSNNTGISHTTSSATSHIDINDCVGDLVTTGIGLFTSTSGGNINIFGSKITNTGASVTASSISTGAVTIDNCVIGFPLSTSSVGSVNITNCRVNSGSATCLTTAGTASSTIFNSSIASGSASAISAGSGTTVSIGNSSIASSNTNAITGAGTISYGDIIFNSSSSTINTTTQTLLKKTLSVVSQVFTSTGTYTPTTGMIYCQIECVGGGGGGGGTGNSGAGAAAVGGGGGGGAYSRIISSAATVGASQAVTIPTAAAGGSAGNNAGASAAATTVGTICTANGGSGGGGNSGSGSSSGGPGGTAGTGDFSVPGGAGGSTISSAITTVIIPFGEGGASCLGFGGSALISTGNTTGNAGQLYGGGGGGGSSFAAAGTAAGGAGGKGIVIITEYVIS